MFEQSHAEQNAEHYKLLRENPEYLHEFKMDVLREEIMMAMPYYPEPQAAPEQVIDPPPYESLRQLRAELNYYKNKLNEHLKPKKQDDPF